tara:strand:+ start:408 stop:953 length:546 start_codon:yes stop_codon:yes gene_type:complete
MKLTKQKLHTLINEALREGSEAREILKAIKGWWSAAEIVAQIEGTWTTDSLYRKSGYRQNPTGSDEFFKDRYVGKNFKLEFLEWTRENRYRRSKYQLVIDAIAIAVTDILFERFPELKDLSEFGVTAPGSPTAKDSYPEHRFRADIMLLVKAVINKNVDHQQHYVKNIQNAIDSLRNLKNN